jgi:hypothetical protein
MRYTPEAASKPDRMVKDLVNAKKLAAILEDEATFLRTFSPKSVASGENKDATTKDDPNDATRWGEKDQGSLDRPFHRDSGREMVDADDDYDPEPRERGSHAVERRIQKIMSELCDQGVIDAQDVKTYEAKKVSIAPLSNRSLKCSR